jgi:hypothetical protein
MDKRELDELLGDHRPYHSDLQMDCFITGISGGTDYGMYKQALRELDKRYRALRHLYIERERLRMKIPGKVAARPRFKFEKRRTLRALETGFALEDLDRNIADTEREFTRFLQQAKALKRRVGELTPERRAVLDQAFWEDRLRRTAAVEFLTIGRMNANTIECINSLPAAARATLLTDCNKENCDNLLKWYLRCPPPSVAALPGDGSAELKALPGPNIEALIVGADRRDLPNYRFTEVDKNTLPDEAAEPCRKQGGGRVRGLFRKAISFIAVARSPDVPNAVYAERMGACRQCPRSSEALGRLWCGCCGCSRWTRGKISSSLEYKNRKAAWGCPLSKPAFGPWKGSG